MRADSSWIDLNTRLLRTWPLPEIAPDADKEVRGRVLVIAGSREISGAAVLAGTAALRAGAGKLVIATARSVAAELAIAVPEARVIALPETPAGAFAPLAVDLLEQAAQTADAVLVGPGLMEESGSYAFVAGLLPLLAHVPVILDALAMNAVKGRRRLTQPLLLPRSKSRSSRHAPGAWCCMHGPEGNWPGASVRWAIWRVNCRRKCRA